MWDVIILLLHIHAVNWKQLQAAEHEKSHNNKSTKFNCSITEGAETSFQIVMAYFNP